ncbi:Nephrocystin-3 [Talaromyces pinophilus]|nr:Nephrocystin-3 [Talaromyces pinophilus]
MATAEYHSTFSNSHNYGLQVGHNIGNIETHHHYTAERPETPPRPSLSIPFLRDPDFVDGGTILDQLYRRCAAPGSRTALVGLGGVGKSQLAIEFAYRIHEQEPETWIFWIYASNAARFEQSYQEIADTAKLFGRQDPKANIFKLVHDWLRDSKNGKWIFILDNIDDAHFLISHPDSTRAQAGHENGRVDRPLREYLPQSRNGSILITSRSREAALKLVDQCDIIVVEPMDEARARALFNKKLGNQDKQHHNSYDVAELAAELDFIPLAIIQAAAYISDPDRGCSVRQYLKKFQKNDRKKIRLLGHEEGQFRRDWEAKNSVLITWQISFESIRESRRSAADLLSLMSFFDRQGIPKALLYDHSGRDAVEIHSEADSDSESQSSVTDKFNNDILILRRYSLISINVDRTTFSMHNLVQLATRQWLEANGELEKWKWQYIRNLNAELPTGEYENWEQCQILFPHAKSAARQKPEGRDALIEWASVLYKAASYDWRKGNGAEGAKLSVRAMKTWKKYLGPDHEKTLGSMEIVGLTHLVQGRWKEAEELFMQVIETRKRVLGVEHPDTLTSMGNLASTYRNQGRWKEAEELDMQVMETTKRMLASTYRNRGRWKEAEELEVQVIEITKRVQGVEHPDTLASIANLASTYRDQGRWKEAEELFMQVMETRKRMLGKEHPSTLTSMGNLASTYRNQGRWKEAEELDVQVMEMTKRMLGVEHPSTLTSMGNLASTYWNQGRWKEAEELEVQVMETRTRMLGVEHPHTLNSMANLAFTLKEQGRGAEALDLMKNCVQLQSKVLGVGHPDTVSASAALIDWQTENLDIDVQGFAEFQLQDRRGSGNNHESIEEYWEDETSAVESDANDQFEDDIVMLRNFSFISFSTDGTSFQMHRLVQLAMQKWLEASGQLEQWKERFVRNLSREFPSGEYENWKICGLIFPHAQSAVAQRPDSDNSLQEWALLLNNAASFAWAKWNLVAAEKMAVRAMRVREKVLGIDHPDTLTSINNLGSVLRSQGKYGEAEMMHRRALTSREKLLGIDHPDTVDSINDLGIVLEKQGEYNEAEIEHRRVLAFEEKLEGISHLNTLTAVSNLAWVLQRQGKYGEAEIMYQRALAFREKVLGIDHPDTLSSVNNLGLVLYSQGKYNEAEIMHRRDLASSEKVLGIDHSHTIVSVGNLSSVLDVQGKYEEAETMYRRCLESEEKLLGIDHPNTLVSVNGLGLVLERQGKYDEAETMHRRAVASKEKVLGSNHPNTLMSVNNLGLVLHSQGKYDEAETMHRRALTSREKVLDINHPNTLMSMWHLSRTWKNQGRDDETLELLQTCMQLQDQNLGPSHPHTISATADLSEWQVSRVERRQRF